MKVDASGGNITALPTPKKKRIGSPLEIVHSGKCQHGKYLVDEKKAEVECGLCHEKLNPIWVLLQIATDDRILRDRWAGMRAELQTMGERVRTKCDHCGKMTRIRSNARTVDLLARAESIKQDDANA